MCRIEERGRVGGGGGGKAPPFENRTGHYGSHPPGATLQLLPFNKVVDIMREFSVRVSLYSSAFSHMIVSTWKSRNRISLILLKYCEIGTTAAVNISAGGATGGENECIEENMFCFFF